MYKKYIIATVAWSVPFLFTFGEGKEDSIDRIMRTIESNNKELKANAQLVSAQKLETRTDNNLPDPSLSYSHLWGGKDKNETIGELVVSQSFDFPSLYATRNKLNRLKAQAFDSQADVARQSILLQAKEVCLDIIMLRRQKQLLDEHLNNAEELAKIYAKRLETGDVNVLKTNKINLELLNIKTEVSQNNTALNNKIQELTALNGNIPIVFEENNYPSAPFPNDLQALRSELLATDRSILALNNESAVAHKQISVNKSQWLPKLEVGYRRNTETGTPFNGVVVGFSFPLFENRNKVKVAKAQALNVDLQKENVVLQTESELTQLYREAEMLHSSMVEYQKLFQEQQDLQLLRKALSGKQINIIEYFVEVAVIYQSKQKYLQLENQYQKTMAEIYKSRL